MIQEELGLLNGTMNSIWKVRPCDHAPLAHYSDMMRQQGHALGSEIGGELFHQVWKQGGRSTTKVRKKERLPAMANIVMHKTQREQNC